MWKRYGCPGKTNGNAYSATNSATKARVAKGRCTSGLAAYADAEQSPRAYKQGEDQEPEYHRVAVVRRYEQCRNRFDDSDGETADDRTRYAHHAAEDDGGERLHHGQLA